MSCDKENDNKLKRNIYNNITIINSKRDNYSVSPNSSKYKKIGNYIILKTIGSGTFSTVKLGLHLPTKQKVAIKILDKSRIKDENDIKRISREIHILSKLYHPNIAQLYETIWSDKHIYIIMEYAEGNHLFEYINLNKRLNEIKASKLFVQLISCLEYIHILGIVHRDIKPENILLNKQKTKIKLVDFGLSNSYKYGTLLRTACGSPCYAPPEMISGKEYQPLYSDLWSCGVVLYCMLVGKLPFDDEDIKVLYKHIKSAKYIIPNFLSNSAKDLLKKILNCNPNKRIRLEDIKKHPFYLMGEKNKNYLDRGILIGIEEIPVNENIVKKMKQIYFKDNKKISENYIINNIKKNCHNGITVIYYLMIKKLEEVKENIHNKTRIKLINADNNIRNININYINNTEFNPNNKLKNNNKIIYNKINENKKDKKEISDIDNISENNYNIEEEVRKEKGNIVNINNIRKLIFNSNDISLKSKYNKDRVNVVVINNILTETPQNKTLNIKSKYRNNTTNNSHENRTLSTNATNKRRMKSFNHTKNISRNERNIYINNTGYTKNKKEKKINLRKIDYKFNDIQQLNINNNKSFNKKENTKKIFNKKYLLNNDDNKTNRINNFLYGLYSYNTTTIREDRKYKSRILTNFNTKRDIKKINHISLIRKKAYNSNPKGKKKSINIYIDESDIMKELEKKKNEISLNNKKIAKNVKQKNTGGVLRSLINSNINNSLRKDLLNKKLKYSYSRSKSKDKNMNNNNINIVLSINENNLSVKNKNINISNNSNKDMNSIKNCLDINRNHSCKNKDMSNNNKIKKLNYTFSSSKIQKKKIHFISQIKAQPDLNKSKKNNSKNKRKK